MGTVKTIYVHSKDNTYRYSLGEIQNSEDTTIVCLGVNPSTATPENPDPTVQKVIKMTKYNGYANWVMVNVYPLRETNPDLLPLSYNIDEMKMNLEEIQVLIDKYHPKFLFAYGDLILKRQWLKDCLFQIIMLLKKCGYSDIQIIKKTKKGNPTHSLYQCDKTKFQTILIDEVLKS